MRPSSHLSRAKLGRFYLGQAGRFEPKGKAMKQMNWTTKRILTVSLMALLSLQTAMAQVISGTTTQTTPTGTTATGSTYTKLSPELSENISLSSATATSLNSTLTSYSTSSLSNDFSLSSTTTYSTSTSLMTAVDP